MKTHRLKNASTHRVAPFVISLLATVLVSALGCQSQAPRLQPSGGSEAQARNADALMVVDCLLPAQVRKLGQQFSYLAARRAIKTTGTDCEIRGGEYVAYDRASYATALKIWLPSSGWNAKRPSIIPVARFTFRDR